MLAGTIRQRGGSCPDGRSRVARANQINDFKGDLRPRETRPAMSEIEQQIASRNAARRRGNHELGYQSGFGNHFASEAVPGALPVGRNSPQRPPHGLYAELISGASFTV